MIQPGYYWIRWKPFRLGWPGGEWHPVKIVLNDDDQALGELPEEARGNDRWFSIDGAELGPRIEPPETK